MSRSAGGSVWRCAVIERLSGGLLVVLCAATSLAATERLDMPTRFEVCVDYHCDLRATVRLDAAHWQLIERVLGDPPNPAVERDRIGTAIALFETLVGEQAGTAGDLAGNGGDGDRRGQLDCISESLNTTRYLGLLEQAKLLRWHRVGERKRRVRWLVSIHWTAVIEDLNTDQSYAVDSWFFPNGAPPVIQPLAHWMAARDPSGQ